MSSLQAQKQNLIKIAVFMQDGYGYHIPGRLVPKSMLTKDFTNASKAYAGDFYAADMIRKISDFSGAYPRLAEDMLGFWKDNGEGKKGGMLHSEIAQKGLKQMQQHGFLSKQMG